MNLTVRNNIGEQFNIVVIRYFNFNGGNYLIFTRNEMDEAGYQKLYISKIVNMAGNDIDDNEWNLVRDTIKVIAKANKENTALPVQDMNEAEVNGIQILGQKPFKLTTSSVALLGANRNLQNHTETVVSNAVISPVASSQVTPVVNEPLFENNIPTAPVMDAVMPVNQPQMSIPGAMMDVNVPNVVTPVEISSIGQPTISPQPFVPMQDAVTPIAPVDSAPLAPVESLVPNFGVQNNEVVPNVITPNPAPVTAQFNAEPISVAPANPNPVVEQIAPDTPVALENVSESVDYKKLYEEQILKLNNLTAELDKYKAIVEQLKNILN